MKAITYLFIGILLNTGGFSNSDINNEVTENGLTYLYGEINRVGLTSKQYGTWFNRVYDQYITNQQKLEALNKVSLNGVTVKLLMATWCGDSKRNVPAFYKIFDSIGLEEDKLRVWALDRRKRGPKNEQLQYGVTRVPTIIFYRDDIEIGRFVERPKPGQKLEDIIVSILTKP